MEDKEIYKKSIAAVTEMSGIKDYKIDRDRGLIMIRSGDYYVLLKDVEMDIDELQAAIEYF